MKKYIFGLALGLMVLSYSITTLASDSPLQILDTHISSSSIAFDVKDENLTNGDQYFMECTEVGNELWDKNPRQFRDQIQNNPSSTIQMMVGNLKNSSSYNCYVAVVKLSGQFVRHSEQKIITTSGTSPVNPTGSSNTQTTSSNAVIMDKLGNTNSILLQVGDLSLISLQQYFASCYVVGDENDYQVAYMAQPSSVDVNKIVNVEVKGLKSDTAYRCQVSVTTPSNGGYSHSRSSNYVNVTTLSNTTNQNNSESNTATTTTGYKLPPASYEDEVLTTFNSNPFPDTNISDLEGKAAAELYRRAVIGGFPDGQFKGVRMVNRAEAAKFLLLARFGTVAEVSNNGQFSDVLDGQWYTSFVVTAALKGIIGGYPDGSFKPANSVNTAEFLKMLTLTFGLDENQSYSYSDVPSDAWFARYAGTAKRYNLFPKRSGQLKPEQELTRNEIAVAIYQYLSMKSVVTNKQITDLFYGDSNYVKVMSGNTYDMNELNYFTNQTNINKDVFAFKVFSALKMLGYNTLAGTNDVGKKSQIIDLNQFQKKYNLTISEKLGKSALSKISEELLKRENNEVKYRELFPLYGNITGLHKNDITKDHVAMLHTLPFQVLPDKFQLKTKDQFAACLQGQCGGQFRDDKFQYIHIQGEPLVFLQSDSILIINLLHEYAHYLDGALYQKYEELVRGVIDTTNFYNISFKDVDKVGQLPFYEKNCFDRRTNDDYEFITSYARSHGTLNRPLCPNEKYAVAEDFAESFSAYVASGKQFRMAAQKNTTINKKYQWLKTNVFGGVEYNTDLVWGNSSGCNDIESVKTQTPGYMSCNEEYIWNGTLPKLGQ